jgi:hypothetical protein
MARRPDVAKQDRWLDMNLDWNQGGFTGRKQDLPIRFTIAVSPRRRFDARWNV